MANDPTIYDVTRFDSTTVKLTVDDKFNALNLFDRQRGIEDARFEFMILWIDEPHWAGPESPYRVATI